MAEVMFGRRFTRIASVVVVAFVLCLLVWVTWRVFGDNPPWVRAGTATAYSAFVSGVLASAWGIYKWARR